MQCTAHGASPLRCAVQATRLAFPTTPLVSLTLWSPPHTPRIEAAMSPSPHPSHQHCTSTLAAGLYKAPPSSMPPSSMPSVIPVPTAMPALSVSSSVPTEMPAASAEPPVVAPPPSLPCHAPAAASASSVAAASMSGPAAVLAPAAAAVPAAVGGGAGSAGAAGGSPAGSATVGSNSSGRDAGLSGAVVGLNAAAYKPDRKWSPLRSRLAAAVLSAATRAATPAPAPSPTPASAATPPPPAPSPVPIGARSPPALGGFRSPLVLGGALSPQLPGPRSTVTHAVRGQISPLRRAPPLSPISPLRRAPPLSPIGGGPGSLPALGSSPEAVATLAGRGTLGGGPGSMPALYACEGDAVAAAVTAAMTPAGALSPRSGAGLHRTGRGFSPALRAAAAGSPADPAVLLPSCAFAAGRFRQTIQAPSPRNRAASRARAAATALATAAVAAVVSPRARAPMPVPPLSSSGQQQAARREISPAPMLRAVQLVLPPPCKPTARATSPAPTTPGNIATASASAGSDAAGAATPDSPGTDGAGPLPTPPAPPQSRGGERDLSPRGGTSRRSPPRTPRKMEGGGGGVGGVAAGEKREHSGGAGGLLTKLQKLQLEDSSTRYLPGYEESGHPQVLPAPPPKIHPESCKEFSPSHSENDDPEPENAPTALQKRPRPPREAVEELAEESEAEYTL